MKVKHLPITISILILLAVAAFGQRMVVHDPTLPAKGGEDEPPKSIAKLYETKILPPVAKKLVSDSCANAPSYTGAVEGSFTKAGAKQTAVFYQFCETGNGLGWVGLAIIEKGKVVSSFVQDSGWAFSIGKVADVNRNGLDEIALEFGGGMHQGEGGTGVSIYEFKNEKPVELGWYQSSKITDTEATTAWVLTAKPGKTPVFYSQKYLSTSNDKWRRSGANKVYRLKKLDGANDFEEVK
ncbi:MAG: hypothetical protein DYH05_02790 [Acidobacteria bacterium ACB1]|nr:hypothetical protein [Pyrinomonadaceae bacterium]MCE7961404.1 hypothetical protein [Acidobacteria bacterium ACB1]RIJ94545.1 MAG: hypothetical protein DCC44_04260 [Acidobacteriota bacterium]